MKSTPTVFRLLIGVLISVNALAQGTAPEAKMSVDERMTKARAARAEKRMTPAQPRQRTPERATAADYRTPVDKTQKGPNGEAVHVGERGGKFYINKNGNKTYLSSNQ